MPFWFQSIKGFTQVWVRIWRSILWNRQAAEIRTKRLTKFSLHRKKKCFWAFCSLMLPWDFPWICFSFSCFSLLLQFCAGTQNQPRPAGMQFSNSESSQIPIQFPPTIFCPLFALSWGRMHFWERFQNNTCLKVRRKSVQWQKPASWAPPGDLKQ